MKKYIWAVPTISGIISILGMINPIASIDNNIEIWMWGLIVIRSFENHIEFINETLPLLAGIIVSLIIIIFSLILIFTGRYFKRGHFNDRKISKLWIICGSFIFAATVISLISLDFFTFYGNFPNGIWWIFDPGFGAIGPFLGSLLAIGIGIYVSSASRRQKNISLSRIPISSVAPKSKCPYCGKSVSFNAIFCSKCGQKIENPPKNPPKI